MALRTPNTSRAPATVRPLGELIGRDHIRAADPVTDLKEH